MEGGFCKKIKLRLWILRTLVVMAVTLRCVVGSSNLHRVGDKMGWAPNVNFSEWSSRERFFTGDWLLFNFDKNMYNVLEVNKTSYNGCNDQNFITNITKGGRDVYQLQEPRPYYFLSGRGFCWGGMKLAVMVQNPTPVSAPEPTQSLSSAKNSNYRIGLFFAVVLVIALV
ncbi:lamin-like protein [Mangifera indica]|uniref:lamin-like protein n=1 Tax=Mangifera indica TaxID=29780 RepID=UPI001CFBE625|nr:lamin-like protein [Mangifera indica]